MEGPANLIKLRLHVYSHQCFDLDPDSHSAACSERHIAQFSLQLADRNGWVLAGMDQRARLAGTNATFGPIPGLAARGPLRAISDVRWGWYRMDVFPEPCHAVSRNHPDRRRTQ